MARRFSPVHFLGEVCLRALRSPHPSFPEDRPRATQRGPGHRTTWAHCGRVGVAPLSKPKLQQGTDMVGQCGGVLCCPASHSQKHSQQGSIVRLPVLGLLPGTWLGRVGGTAPPAAPASPAISGIPPGVNAPMALSSEVTATEPGPRGSQEPAHCTKQSPSPFAREFPLSCLHDGDGCFCGPGGKKPAAIF